MVYCLFEHLFAATEIALISQNFIPLQTDVWYLSPLCCKRDLLLLNYFSDRGLFMY